MKKTKKNHKKFDLAYVFVNFENIFTKNELIIG